MRLRHSHKATGFRRWARLSLLIGAIAILLTTFVAPFHWTTGQEINDIYFDLTPGVPSRFTWSVDSQHATFFMYGIDGDPTFDAVVVEPNWFSIDVNTGAVSQPSTVWPFQPALSAAELQAFNPADFIYASPNGQVLFFAQELVTDQPALYALASRQQGTTLTTDKDVILPLGMQAFRAFWSDDGSALAVSYLNFWGRVYIYYFDVPDENDLSTITVYEFNPVIDGVEYLTFDQTADALYDISADGERALLVARQSHFSADPPLSIYAGPVMLFVWTPRGPDNTLLFDTFDGNLIRAAAFAPHDDMKAVLVVEGHGLVLYDLLSGQSVDVPIDLSPEVGFPEDWGQAWDSIVRARIPMLFSPNGAWLTVDNGGRFLILDIASRVSQITFDQPPDANTR